MYCAVSVPVPILLHRVHLASIQDSEGRPILELSPFLARQRMVSSSGECSGIIICLASSLLQSEAGRWTGVK